jgi:D-lactate dehydrogenase
MNQSSHKVGENGSRHVGAVPHDQTSAALVADLRTIVGPRRVLTKTSQTGIYTTGYRYGGGSVSAVVLPGSLVELWRVLKRCAASRTVVIMQAANTGLTGGSTPDGLYDRPLVLINTKRMRALHLIGGGRQAVCLPGTTLHELEGALRPLGREPHSVIGSSCFGASVLGGICNNSGGSLVQRGPAYTEYALFAKVDDSGELQLVNHLGIALGTSPEEILERLEHGRFEESDVSWSDGRRGSDSSYVDHVRQIGANTPARYNADPSRLFEASGSAGKIALFAVRTDTFPAAERAAVFYIGTNSTDELGKLRRDILSDFASLPVLGEYMHRSAFDVAARYGKDMFLVIRRLGTDRLPALFAAKGRVDALARKLPFVADDLSDRLFQLAGRLMPQHLPTRMNEFRDRFEHHLILKMSGTGVDEARAYLEAAFGEETGAFFECTAEEAEKALLHRFVAAGAAIRYRAVHRRKVGEIVALDIALRRNDRDWFEELPDEIEQMIVQKLYYGHFFCHVFHQDYILRPDADAHAIEEQMLGILDDRGAEYPAEHNVGHCYEAKPILRHHYRALDPRNVFNPGIGKTPRGANWETA